MCVDGYWAVDGEVDYRLVDYWLVCVDGYWAVDGEVDYRLVDYWLVVCTARKRGVLIPAHYNYGVIICRCMRIVTVSVCITPIFFFFTLVRLASFSKTS